MHILIVHNKYGNFSGEEAVIDKLSMSFSKRGHVVDYFLKVRKSAILTFYGNDCFFYRFLFF